MCRRPQDSQRGHAQQIDLSLTSAVARRRRSAISQLWLLESAEAPSELGRTSNLPLKARSDRKRRRALTWGTLGPSRSPGRRRKTPAASFSPATNQLGRDLVYRVRALPSSRAESNDKAENETETRENASACGNVQSKAATIVHKWVAITFVSATVWGHRQRRLQAVVYE